MLGIPIGTLSRRNLKTKLTYTIQTPQITCPVCQRGCVILFLCIIKLHCNEECVYSTDWLKLSKVVFQKYCFPYPKFTFWCICLISISESQWQSLRFFLSRESQLVKIFINFFQFDFCLIQGCGVEVAPESVIFKGAESGVIFFIET